MRIAVTTRSITLILRKRMSQTPRLAFMPSLETLTLNLTQIWNWTLRRPVSMCITIWKRCPLSQKVVSKQATMTDTAHPLLKKPSDLSQAQTKPSQRDAFANM